MLPSSRVPSGVRVAACGGVEPCRPGGPLKKCLRRVRSRHPRVPLWWRMVSSLYPPLCAPQRVCAPAARALFFGVAVAFHPPCRCGGVAVLALVVLSASAPPPRTARPLRVLRALRSSGRLPRPSPAKPCGEAMASLLALGINVLASPAAPRILRPTAAS